MSDGAATLEVAGAGAESRRAAIRAAGTGFSVGRMLAVTRKELRSYFAFPLVYVLSGIFLVLAGYYAYTDLVYFVTIAFSRDIMQNYWQLLFSDIRLCMLLTLPFITMRLFAEERKLGTIELLYTYPLRDGEILGGKFLASVAIFIMMLALTLLYPIIIYNIHWYPLFPLMAGYLGLLLIGCGFIACGVFVSSLCESQVMAGMGTITLLLFFWILNWNEAVFANSWLELIARLFVVRSVRRLRQRRDRSRSRHLLHFLHTVFSVSHAALDGGTQVDGPPLKDTPAAERRSIWLNYAVLFYTVVAFAAMLFVANAIISTFNIRWDLTPQKQFSLSDFDKRVLAGLTHNVKVMAFVRTEDPAYLELADLLFQAAAYTPAPDLPGNRRQQGARDGARVRCVELR